jgi:CxxC motif-containing protein (DUF1111 family)
VASLLLLLALIYSLQCEFPADRWTSSFSDKDAIQLPAPAVTDPAKRSKQLLGFIPFHSSFSVTQGLGPYQTNSSCGGCHVNNLKGPIDILGRGIFGSSAVVKIGFQTRNGVIKPIKHWGFQIPLSNSRLAVDLGVKLVWVPVRVRLINGVDVTLRRPEIRLKPRKALYKRLLRPLRGERLVTALRVSPQLIGPGLLEKIPEEIVLVREDHFDSDGDGIKGKAVFVKDENGVTRLGRFGYQAQFASLMQQTAFAFKAEMGLENRFFGNKIEVSDRTLSEVVAYLKYSGVPKPVATNQTKFEEGKHVFRRIGCEKCHSMDLQIQSSDEPEFSNLVISPLSDLLVHDLGKGLCDPFASDARGRCRWRTSPLWGLSLSKRENSRAGGHFLHDGRARSLEEAIFWHQGTAKEVLDNFVLLSEDDKEALIYFLNNL